MSVVDLAGVVRELKSADSILVSTHIGPDGDAIGSMLAMGHLLRALGKTRVVCACSDPVPRVYQWLSGADEVRVGLEGAGDYDLVVLVDVSRRNRIGRISELIGAETRVLVVDHHLDDAPCGAANFIDSTYAAVGEILAELYEIAGVPLTLQTAECMYVAQITDTGGYRFSSTNGRSHRLAARLVDAGVDVAEISSRIFDAMSPAKFQLLRTVLDRVQIAYDGRVAYSGVSAQEMSALNALGEDVDGLVNFARNIEGVEVAMLFKEVGPETTKVSLRSRRSFNSALFLQRFGGGGHAGAAGATLAFPLSEAQARLLDALGETMGAAV